MWQSVSIAEEVGGDGDHCLRNLESFISLFGQLAQPIDDVVVHDWIKISTNLS